MALIDQVRFSLRISTTDDNNINAELQQYISEAIADLVETSNIKEFTEESADALLKGAIIDYCHFKFERDATLKDAYLRSYESAKTKLSTARKYSTMGAPTNGTTDQD